MKHEKHPDEEEEEAETTDRKLKLHKRKEAEMKQEVLQTWQEGENTDPAVRQEEFWTHVEKANR